jgi:hypothetical protein
VGATRFDQVFGLWEEGHRRVAELEGPDRRAAERVVDELVYELRRRIGPSFTANELAGYYLNESGDWWFAIAVRVAPWNPAAWDMATVLGSAYARFVRSAADWGGGRRLELD